MDKTQIYKAIISDIDGTIAPISSHPSPSKKVRKAIKKLNIRKIPFVLATGKPFSLIEHLIDELELISPIIVDNGAAIYDSISKNCIWESVISKKSAEKILEISKSFNKTVRVSSGKNSFEVNDKLSLNYVPTKFMIRGLTLSQTDEYIKNIETRVQDVVTSRTSAMEGDKFLDVYITNAEATKQHSVLKVAEILKISTNEIIGIGDHYNDFPLLMACGLKVAMGNAVPELKVIADYIAPSVDENGIVDVINKFFISPNL